MRCRLLLSLLACVACGRSGPPAAIRSVHIGQRTHVVLTPPEAAEPVFARRIDGSIQREFPAVLIGSSLEYVVVTGALAGVDQCKVLVFDGDSGEPRASYQPRAVTPWPPERERRNTVGGYRRVMTCPNPQLVRVIRLGDRRFLAVVAAASTAPSNFALLEVTPSGFSERFVFWNLGHIHEYLIHDPWLVVFGVNNTFESTTWRLTHYSPIIAVFRLDQILRGGGSTQVAVSPASGKQTGNGWEFYIVGSSDRMHSDQFNVPKPAIEGSVLTAQAGSGLKYTVHLDTGKTVIEASEHYEAEFKERRLLIDEQPDLEQHLAELNGSVKVLRR